MSSETETHRRSIAKAITWRLMATVLTALIAFAIWGSVGGALKIGVADLFIKLVAYYGHERMWLVIPYGKPKPVDYEI
jgi:uncharacterized membrane protein